MNPCLIIISHSNLYSDHAPIYLTEKNKRNSNKQHTILQTPVIKTTKLLWNPDAIDEIKKLLDHSSPNIIASVEDINESPKGMNISATNFSNGILDTFSKFCEKEIIYNKNSLRGSKQSSKSNTNSGNKPWIDDRCKALHQEYRKSLSTSKHLEHRIIMLNSLMQKRNTKPSKFV